VTGLLADCRHALRLYARTPGASLISVFVLAIGTAFVCAFLSLYVDLILRPHPGFEDSDRIATVGQVGGEQLLGLPFLVVERMSEELGSVEAVAASHPLTVLIGSDRQEARTELVSRQFFSGLRPRLALGRGFEAEEHRPDAEPVAVISWSLWRSRFGGNPDVLGTVIEVTRDARTGYTEARPMEFNGQQGFMILPGAPPRETSAFRIVGVMADTLSGLAQPETALWVPYERTHSLYVASDQLLAFAAPRTYVRKRPGVEIPAVMGEIESRYTGQEFMFSDLYTLDAVDGIVRDIDVHRDANRQLAMFLTGSILLALAAAANVSLFLFARAPGRRRELGIRMAVGAPMKRLVRQLAAEAGLLVAGSALAGLLLSVWLGAFLRGLALLRDAEWRHVTLLDWRVLGLAGVFLLILTLIVSVAPILGLKRFGIAESSRQIASRASPVQRLAGTAQIAVAGAFGAAAIAFAWHLGSLLFGDPGYELDDRYLARFDAPERGLPEPGAPGPLAITRLRESIEAIPGVTAAAFGSFVPGEEREFRARVPDPDDPANEIDYEWGMIDSRFIDTLGLNLLHGHAPEDSEDDVVLVNQTFARMWFGLENVVGETMPFAPMYTGQGARIVGVLEDLSFEHPSAAVPPTVFITSTYLSDSYGAAVIETGLTPAALQQALNELAVSGELELKVSEVRPLASLRGDLLAPDRARGLLTIATAALVVLVTLFGFYGTQRYLVAAGRREYAIRASLGAGPRALGRLVISRGLVLGLPGLVIGALLAFTTVAWLRSEYVAREVSPGMVTTWVVIGLVLLLIAASAAPARAARRTQPAPLLRED
jgi:ABC-type antimicrobial peptide transport system permease subunit